MNKQLKAVGTKMGIPKSMTSHTARHTFATNFLEFGGKIEVLKEILCHSSINETMKYAHITDKQKAIQIKGFDRGIIMPE